MEVGNIDNKKIFFIKINSNNQIIKVEVGKNTHINGEMVIAILYEPYRKIFLICTPSHGVVRGKSIMVPESIVIEIEDFDVD